MAKTIMIVDDEADIRTTVKAILEKNKYKVITAINGDDCLEKLKREKPDLNEIIEPRFSNEIG